MCIQQKSNLLEQCIVLVSFFNYKMGRFAKCYQEFPISLIFMDKINIHFVQKSNTYSISQINDILDEIALKEN